VVSARLVRVTTTRGVSLMGNNSLPDTGQFDRETCL
jgi:hypothetical protein